MHHCGEAAAVRFVMDFFRFRMRLFEHFRFGDRIQHLLGPSERTGKVNGPSKQLGAGMVLHPGPMSVVRESWRRLYYLVGKRQGWD